MEKENWEKWTKQVLNKEGLKNWRIKKNKMNGDGLTLFEPKTIICPEGHYALFLHEITHALLGKNHTKRNNHGAVWADIFTKMCKDYLTLLEKT